MTRWQSYLLLLILCVAWSFPVRSQQSEKHDPFKVLEQLKLGASEKREFDNFDRWGYSEKKHATFWYYAPQFHQGFSRNANPYNFNQDAGFMHRSFLVEGSAYRLNGHAWIEYNGFVGGTKMKDFINQMEMISPPNDGFSESHEVSIQNFYLENLFFDGKLDVTVGKMDPLFITLITTYAGWDRYNHFAKSAASDPVPNMDAGMGLCVYYSPTKLMSFGVVITDSDPKNDYLYIPNFNQSNWNYQAAAYWKFAGSGFSEHNFVLYNQPSFTSNEGTEQRTGSGWAYTGNQEVWKDKILVLKLSQGRGRIDKLNGAYVAGLTFKDPAKRIGDQAGFAMIVNEKEDQYEYGTDLYWRFFLKEWINVGTNVQAYYTINDRVNWVVGGRVFIGY